MFKMSRPNVLLQILRHYSESTRIKQSFNSMSQPILKRGALIVFEGCDRTGKTTQCKLLVDKLKSAGVEAMFMNFPDRSTQCGQLINGYLTRKDDFTDEGIHLMFTLNRWEKMKEMEKHLNSGVNLLVDRYSFSGVAFSAAKGLNIEWCKAPEAGLLKPDLVFLLTVDAETLSKRGGFGDERYEIPEFQNKVMKMYQLLKDEEYWKEVTANKTPNELTDELFGIVLNTIKHCEGKALQKLW